jgi:hexosaminidase
MQEIKKVKLFYSAALLLSCIILLASCQRHQINQNPTLALNQIKLNTLANSLQVKYKFLSNIETDCPDVNGKKITSCYGAEIWLTNPIDLAINNFKINFSQVYPIFASKSDYFTIKHINGDIHQISPKKSFIGFKAKETKKIKLWVNSTLLTESELMPNYWLSAKKLQPMVIKSTQTSFDKATGLELQPYVMSFDNMATQIKASPDDINQYASSTWLYEHEAVFEPFEQNTDHLAYAIIPTPKSVKPLDITKKFDFAKGVNLSLQGIDEGVLAAAFSRLELLGFELVASNVSTVELLVVKNTNKAPDWRSGHYQLTVNESNIIITAQDDVGAFYGLQSLASLIKLESKVLPLVAIDDQPHYAYRGQHVDVARNFRDKAFIFRLIEQMAAYKLNKLHLHLAEDEGWRLEIPNLPELTQIGSKRCMNLSDDNGLQPQLGGAQASVRDGFYTVNDYKNILRYASKHHIEVIPSLDMPGHSRAAIKAMEARYYGLIKKGDEVAAKQYLLTDFTDKTQYQSIQHYSDNTLNVCMESTYTFIDKVLNELNTMHIQAQHPLALYHIGADETAGAWLASPVCKDLIAQQGEQHLGAYFIERVATMVAKKGISVGGWNDGLKETRTANMPKNTYSYIWGALPGGAHQQVSEQSHRGWNIVLSIPDVLYFDFPYQVDPKEPGYNWASRRLTTRSLFNFMPDNLPIHAEFRVDILGKNFISDDRLQKDDHGNITHQPLVNDFKIQGLQGQLWSETVRSEQQAEYMIYPRLLALAERAWHQASWQVPYDHKGKVFDKNTGNFTDSLKVQRDKSWLAFSQAIGLKELAKLERAGVFYRLPTVGAIIKNDKLHANTAIKGLPIEYQEKVGNWKIYTKPVKAQVPVKIRTKSVDLMRSGRTSIVN